MLVRDSQAHEDRPPVVDQGRDAGHDLASLPVVRGKAGPRPLVLQLVEIIFRISSVAGSVGRSPALRPASMSPAPRTHTAHPSALLRADPRPTVWPPFVWFSSRPLPSPSFRRNGRRNTTT